MRQKLFPLVVILSFSLLSFSYSIMIRNMAGVERYLKNLLPRPPYALCLFRNMQRDHKRGAQARRSWNSPQKS